MARDAIVKYTPGSDLTCVTTAAVQARRFAKISGNKQGTIATSGVNYGLDTTASGGRIKCAHADAGGRIAGVFRRDAASGGETAVIRGSSTVVPVYAEVAITAGDPIKVGAAAGAAVANGTTDREVGYAIADAAAGADVLVSLYY